jgi:hypothetical protein
VLSSRLLSVCFHLLLCPSFYSGETAASDAFGSLPATASEALTYLFYNTVAYTRVLLGYMRVLLIIWIRARESARQTPVFRNLRFSSRGIVSR